MWNNFLGIKSIVVIIVVASVPDVMSVTECISVQNIDITRGHQQILNGTCDHVPRIQEQ